MSTIRSRVSHRIYSGVLGMLAGLYLVAACSDASAKGPNLNESPSPVEMALLPLACQARLKEGFNGPSSAKWKQVLGDHVYLSLHHYCFALNSMNRAKFATDTRAKKYYLHVAINEFDYVLRGWPKDTPLRRDAEEGKLQAQLLTKMLPK